MKKTYVELELELLQTQHQLAFTNMTLSQAVMNELAPKIAAKEAEVRNQPHLRPD